MKRYQNNKNGFTLIELLVVVAIIALLASIVIASLGSARKKIHETQIKENLVQLRNALELYYTANGSYPNTNRVWFSQSPAYSNSGPNGWIPGLVPTYISQLPKDQYTGIDRTNILDSSCDANDVYYFYMSDGKDYKVQAWCLVEYFVPSTDPFYDFDSSGNYGLPGVDFAIFTPNAKPWQ